MGPGLTFTPEHVKLYTSDGKLLAVMWNAHGIWTTTPPNCADTDDVPGRTLDFSEVL